MCHQRDPVVEIGGHECERGHRASAAREHLDRAGIERLDHGVHVIRLDRGRLVDPAVFADAAAEAPRVIGDHGAVGEVRCQRGEAGGGHGLPDHEQRRASAGSGQWAVDVVGDIGLGGFKDVHRRHDNVDLAGAGNSSARPKHRAASERHYRKPHPVGEPRRIRFALRCSAKRKG